MKLYTVLAVTIFLVSFAVRVAAAQSLFAPAQGSPLPSVTPQNTGTLSTQVQEFTSPSSFFQPTETVSAQLQLDEHLFTPALLEPNGFVAVCFATNLDSIDRALAAQIVDSTGADVTETSSCGAGQRPGVTCQSTAHFSANSALRCVVGTSGRALNLRGGMTTSAGPFPFLNPANLTVMAQ
jgi:hypothetical protein